MLLTKALPLEVKDIDATKGVVTFYGSAFGNKDSDGDIVVPGAYTKTLSESGPAGTGRIRHLWQHDSQEIIGKFLGASQDGHGLLLESQLAKTARGKDAAALYELGVGEHSIGYVTLKNDRRADGNYLQELRLREVSFVTWGANALTPLVGMKGEDLTPAEAIKGLHAKLDRLTKALRTGNLTDETCESLELGLQHLKRGYDELLTAATALKTESAALGTEPAGQPTASDIVRAFKTDLNLN